MCETDESGLDDGIGYGLDRLGIVRQPVVPINPLVGSDNSKVRGDIKNDALPAPRHFVPDNLAAQKRTSQSYGNISVPLFYRKIFQTLQVGGIAFHLGVVAGVIDEDVGTPRFGKNK